MPAIVPYPCFFITGIMHSSTCAIPNVFTAKVCLNCSLEKLCIQLGPPTPELIITRSMLSSISHANTIPSLTFSSNVTSHFFEKHLLPFELISAESDSISFSFLERSTSDEPVRANSSASALPMPCEAPNNTTFLNLFIIQKLRKQSVEMVNAALTLW